ncbi:MAG: hypothetical protein PVH87_09755 [Desulfobacteraceae bacterium]|jgi:hypothetical protein
MYSKKEIPETYHAKLWTTSPGNGGIPELRVSILVYFKMTQCKESAHQVRLSQYDYPESPSKLLTLDISVEKA